MSQTSSKRCPICNGSRKMEILQFAGIEKKVVKVPCTACGGTGKILYVNHSITEEPESKSNVDSVKGFSDGWRRHGKWDKVHYLRDGRFLCRNIRSTKKILESIGVYNPDKSTMCSTCSRRLMELSS